MEHLIQKYESIISSKEEISDIIQEKKKKYLDDIILQIKQLVKKRLKLKNKYYLLIKKVNITYLKDINLIIAKELFDTNFFFNIKSEYKLFNGLNIYIKFYDDIIYENKIKKRFNKKINEGIKKNKTKIYLYDNIAYKNYLRVLCYQRNYNIIFKEKDYKFDIMRLKYEDGLGEFYKYGLFINFEEDK